MEAEVIYAEFDPQTQPKIKVLDRKKVDLKTGPLKTTHTAASFPWGKAALAVGSVVLIRKIFF